MTSAVTTTTTRVSLKDSIVFQSSESEDEDTENELVARQQTRHSTESESEDEDAYTIYAPKTRAEPIALDFASLTQQSDSNTVVESRGTSVTGRPNGNHVVVTAPSLRVFQQLGEDIKQQGALIRRTCNTYRYCVALIVIVVLILLGVIIWLLVTRK